MGWKIGCESQLVDVFVKQHIQEMRKKARERGLLRPIHPSTNEWYFREHKRRLAAEKKKEVERAREAKKVQMQVMKDLVAGLPRFPRECFNYLFVLVACLYFYLRC